MWNKKLINKKYFKLSAQKCFFCDVDDYACLHCHRILPEEHGGVYTDFNTLVVCANHHELIHDGKIIIDRKYSATNQRGWVLHYWCDGEEKWD